ncbi:TetR/AcrR family transcriptional regulator [Nannocystaceae bacterium ST9]
MRTYGAKNADHDLKREEMIALISPHVMQAAPERPSMREMARAAGISVNNLRHYFGTREQLIEAVFEHLGRAGDPYVRQALGFAELPVVEGLTIFLRALESAWTPEQLGGLHLSGISEGLGSPALGPAYVEFLLEPTLVVAERLLERWHERGLLEIDDARVAGLALLSPLVLALLHQRGLGGTRCRPLDFAAMIERHVAAFVRGWAPTS